MPKSFMDVTLAMASLIPEDLSGPERLAGLCERLGYERDVAARVKSAMGSDLNSDTFLIALFTGTLMGREQVRAEASAPVDSEAPDEFLESLPEAHGKTPTEVSA